MMKIKFANGVVKQCLAPTEQKVFNTAVGTSGWILHLRLTGEITSAELDDVIKPDSISVLEFLTNNENGEDVKLFELDGYSKITSSTIRYADNPMDTTTEIQITKGI